MKHRVPEGVSSTAQTVAALRADPLMTIPGPIVTGAWDGPPLHAAQETTPLDDRPTVEIEPVR